MHPITSDYPHLTDDNYRTHSHGESDLGGKSPIWMPMAYTIIFGLALATTMTLFVMPALYAITTDLRGLVTEKSRRTIPKPSQTKILLGVAVPADD